MHSSTINVYFGPLSSSSSHPFLLLLPLLLHFHHLFSCLSSIPVPSPLLPLLIGISCLHHSFWSYSAPPPHSFYFFAVSHCFVFFHHSHQIKRIPPTPIRIFIPNFCAYALACAHLFLRAAFIQVNFSSSRVNRSAFRRTRMRCF